MSASIATNSISQEEFSLPADDFHISTAARYCSYTDEHGKMCRARLSQYNHGTQCRHHPPAPRRKMVKEMAAAPVSALAPAVVKSLPVHRVEIITQQQEPQVQPVAVHDPPPAAVYEAAAPTSEPPPPPQSAEKVVTLRRMVAAISIVLRIAPAEFLSKEGMSNRPPEVFARQVLCYLLRNDGGVTLLGVPSFPAIGRLLGQHHTTLMHGFKKMAKAADTDPVRGILEQIRSLYKEDVWPYGAWPDLQGAAEGEWSLPAVGVLFAGRPKPSGTKKRNSRPAYAADDEVAEEELAGGEVKTPSGTLVIEDGVMGGAAIILEEEMAAPQPAPEPAPESSPPEPAFHEAAHTFREPQKILRAIGLVYGITGKQLRGRSHDPGEQAARWIAAYLLTADSALSGSEAGPLLGRTSANVYIAKERIAREMQSDPALAETIENIRGVADAL